MSMPSYLLFGTDNRILNFIEIFGTFGRVAPPRCSVAVQGPNEIAYSASQK